MPFGWVRIVWVLYSANQQEPLDTRTKFDIPVCTASRRSWSSAIDQALRSLESAWDIDKGEAQGRVTGIQRHDAVNNMSLKY
jgi:hypothetical protein